MSLRKYQVEIQPDTLYEIKEGYYSAEDEVKSINVEIVGADCNIYGSNKGTAPTTLSEMSLEADSPQSGILPFGVVPRYLAISGSPTSIILTGIEIENNLGAIS
jgi:hypothetical protein